MHVQKTRSIAALLVVVGLVLLMVFVQWIKRTQVRHAVPVPRAHAMAGEIAGEQIVAPDESLDSAPERPGLDEYDAAVEGARTGAAKATAAPRGDTADPVSILETIAAASWMDAPDEARGGHVPDRAQPSESETPASADRPEHRQYVDVLKMPWQQKNERREELQEAIAKLASMGDAVIEPIMREFKRHDQTFAFRHKAVQVFEAMKTPKARETLLRIALGETIEQTKSLKEWAARAYITSLEDRAEARQLLVSPDTGVLNKVLLALRGEPVDRALLSRVAEIVEWNDLPLCWASAAVLAADPTWRYIGEKCSLLVKAVTAVPRIPRADEIYPHSHYTYAETTYSHYIDALYKMRGAEPHLRYLTPRTFSRSDRVRECLLIARARRGDVSVRDGLIQILQDPRAEMFRAWAALGLGRIGTELDLPLLRRVAESDPLERDRGISVPLPDRQFFPVREAAKQTIQALESGR